ncbi:MAG TPA: hypothetical protein PLI93_08935 [Gemmatimonadales bacterium]|nr:hypothetical protein [Gemmatimonadota bacterium]MCB9505915.1 hypothetical protein [Gemmatimonadales bacterium]MCA9769252.1 hypothetical protein [Gemmatimonadota bacterium]MCB9518863.1 hypothetical protein [Gemmatimonadales bacterium]HPF62168.1 hypothetical protein [Gemmatimonadales bacterium]
MPAIRALTLVLAAPIALLGPPRVTVAAGAPGAPMTVTVEHTGEVGHAVVTVRALSLDGRRTRERVLTAVETTASAKDARAFLVTPPRTPGVPQVLVIRGAHGTEDDAPFMEAMVRVTGEGAVVGIEYSQRKSLLGGYRFPAFSDEDITSALTRLAAR